MRKNQVPEDRDILTPFPYPAGCHHHGRRGTGHYGSDVGGSPYVRRPGDLPTALLLSVVASLCSQWCLLPAWQVFIAADPAGVQHAWHSERYRDAGSVAEVGFIISAYCRIRVKR
ncbi:hypothetical protein KCP70_07635 [Salmonella enterica subsp. enterica]|nr:hypothetical protein KCP70_07635 [Salmonella enterica subsp. enterica]